MIKMPASQIDIKKQLKLLIIQYLNKTIRHELNSIL